MFEAEWIWRDPSPTPMSTDDVAWRQVTTTIELERWERAWRDNGSPTDRRVFTPELLADPTVALFAAYRDDVLAGGCAANISGEVVGFSNFFAVGQDAEPLSVGALETVGRFGTGLPIVGYETGDALERAKRIGFRSVGPLRVWRMAAS